MIFGLTLLDSKGRLFGKINVFDIIVVVAVIGLVAGFGMRFISTEAQRIFDANTPFYVTFVIERIREYSVDGVRMGDQFMEQHAQRLGEVVQLRTEPARQIMHKDDGTAVFALMEDRYNIFITLRCYGSVTDHGFYINGNRLVAPGSTVRIQSQQILSTARVHSINMGL